MTEPSRQGEVWRIDTVAGRHIRAVVLDSTPFVTRSRMLAVAQIREAFDMPQNLLLLAVPIAEPTEGVISLSDVQVYRRDRFTELLGSVDGDTMARVKTALAARFDLDL